MRERALLTLAALALLGCPADSPEPPPGDATPIAEDTPPVAVPDIAEDTTTPSPGLAVRLGPEQVRAGQIQDPSALIGGLKADGLVGDFKIYNSEVAFVIEAARPTSGYRYRGGSVADADIVRPAGEPGQDHFGEVIRTWNLEILYPESVEVVSDGADGLAHIRVRGPTGTFLWAKNNSFLSTFELEPTGLEVTWDYTLAPGDTALRLHQTLHNPTGDDSLLDFNVTISNHGDGVFPWTPGTGFGVPAGGDLPYVGASSRTLAYALLSPTEGYSSLVDYSAISILLREPINVPAGESVTSDTWIAVTGAGPAGLDAAARALLGAAPATGRVEGQVSTPDTADPTTAWVAVWQAGAVVTLAPTGPDGAFVVPLPPGDYTLVGYAPDHSPSAALPVAITAGATTSADPTIGAVARVLLTTTDDSGAPLPARVTFLMETPGVPGVIPPVVDVAGAEPWPEGVAYVAYAADGSAEALLPAGTYTVVASHGFTHELAEAPLVAVAGEDHPLSLEVARAVDTTGWISADFHLHGYRSWDAHVPYAHRAREAACEGLDAPVLTEHGYAASLAPAVLSVGLADVLAPVPGQEVTSLSYGHFNLFPLVPDLTAIHQGGVFPLDKTPLELFAAMRDALPGPEVVQVNHPRGAGVGGYFAFVGLDPKDLSVAKPEDWTTDWDAVEVFNGQCGDIASLQTLTDWIALYNHGVRRALSSGSDSHDRTVPPGYPRNWLPLTLAELQADPAALVAPVHARQMVVSCGPFLTVEAADGTLPGGRTTPSAGEVAFHVRVQAPTWIAVDEVRLLENGEVIDVVPVTPGPDSVVRVDMTLTVAPTKDAWYAVQVYGTGSMSPVAWVGEPFAMSNPIEVDADVDGVWTAPLE